MTLTPEHHAFRSMIASFVDREIQPFVDEWEAEGRFPAHELFRKIGDLGVFGLAYDPKYGGSGADQGYLLIAAEELGRIRSAGVSMGIGVHMMMTTPSLHEFGAEALKQKYLVPALLGETVSAIGVTEPDAGSDVAGLRTRGVIDGDEWVINGLKTYITNGTQADWICLLVRTTDEGGYRGMSQIIVDMDAPGVSVSKPLDKLGNRSSDTAEITFENVRAPLSNTIGEPGRGFQQQMSQFVVERMFACYSRPGALQDALDRTAEYLQHRTVFGRPSRRTSTSPSPWPSFRPDSMYCARTTGRWPMPSRPVRTPREWLRSPSCLSAVSRATLPMRACNSTAAWGTWKSIGLHGSFATNG